MRLLQKTKDGGPASPVTAYFLCEFKGLFSVALLRFGEGSRSNYHSHAFNALTFFLKGSMNEYMEDGPIVPYKKFKPKLTRRNDVHKVYAREVSWALTFRGPWKDN